MFKTGVTRVNPLAGAGNLIFKVIPNRTKLVQKALFLSCESSLLTDRLWDIICKALPLEGRVQVENQKAAFIKSERLEAAIHGR